MTVSYAGEVPNGSSFGCFWKILWKWRGSVYKLVWRELLAYLLLYYTINLLYRFALTEEQKNIFKLLRAYFGQQGESIPMSFVLGFYVSLVVKRWWEQYRLLPWPDTLALFISAAIPNSAGEPTNETGRLMRRNIMRYMVLAYVITLQRISLRVKRRFPTTQHLVDAGLMHESEMKIFDALNQRSPMSKYWMPLVWATNILNRARKDNLIVSDHIVQTILMELSDIRRRLGGLIGYDTVCVPLVYTQVVTLVLYTYFIAALLGRQMLPDLNTGEKKDSDLYFPLFTALQFVFYVGWLKVAEVLINPFGEDDDDIELNWLIDRHIKAAYMIVDEMHEEHPELLRDQYWECVVPQDLPYTVASEHYRRDEPKGSAEHYKIKKEDAMYANIMPSGGKRVLVDDVYADYESVDTPMVERRKNNWLVRQLSRMGSMRSQATSYSSGGVAYNRNRLNSVYSSPESGLPLSILQQQQQLGQGGPLTLQQQLQQQQQQMNAKPSLYEKFVHRKSLRQQKQLLKQNSRLNGLGANVQKARPRIPTPDATREIGEKDAKLQQQLAQHNLGGTGVTTTKNTNALIGGSTNTQAIILAPNQSQSQSTTISNKNSALHTHSALYPYNQQQQQLQQQQQQQDSHQHHNNNNLNGLTTNQVLGTLLLSPIKEMDCSSTNNTLIPGHATTTALAQAVLKDGSAGSGVGAGVNTSVPATSTASITTLSFPFSVSTIPADTMSSATTHLNILPIATTQTTAATSLANTNGLVNVSNDAITTIPVSVSIQRTTSTPSINELAEHPDEHIIDADDSIGSNSLMQPTTTTTTTTSAHLTIKPLKTNLDDSYLHVNRTSSVRSTGAAMSLDSTNLNSSSTLNKNDAVDGGGGGGAGKLNGNATNSTSAPSTLAKRSPEAKTGEVYV